MPARRAMMPTLGSHSKGRRRAPHSAQQMPIRRVVARLGEQQLPAGAALRHVMRGRGNGDARESSHGRGMSAPGNWAIGIMSP